VDDFFVRKLFIPEDGRWVCADQAQVEYRIFAHYAKAEWILEEYRKNPWVDFHTIVMHMIRKVKADIDRDRTKDLNFAFLYGAGIGKIAVMLGISYGEAQSLMKTYKRMFPEADTLMKVASKLASRRGYVKTILGRRGRFPDKQFLHKALNKVVQGSAADSAKKKLIALHKCRKETGFVMRFPVHDEINGDSPDPKCTEMVTEVLNEQSIPFRVPILWAVKTGATWAEAK
jgi:DNA polymerase-1